MYDALELVGRKMSSLEKKHAFFFLFFCIFASLAEFCVFPPCAAAQNRSSGIEDIKIYVRAADGSQFAQIAQVSLVDESHQVVEQATTHGGIVEFYGVKGGNYTLEVVAAGYEKSVESLDIGNSGGGVFHISLKPTSDARESHTATGPPLLSPAAQKELVKSSQALRSNNLKDARTHLDAAARLVPSNPEVNYLFGLYWAKGGDWPQAKACWEKTLSLSPNNLSALLALSEALIREKKYPEAMKLLNQAVDKAPSTWRPHAMLAEAYLKQGMLEESIQQSERALELGHDQATPVQPILLRALLLHGDTPRAIEILRAQVQSHPDDMTSKLQLQKLEGPAAPQGVELASPSLPDLPAASLTWLVDSPLISSSWLPPDLDEKVPPVLSGRVCDLDQVLSNTAARVQELVSNVDKYTATESLFHESVNKWGSVSSSENLSFNYLVSIEEISPGSLSVEEVRDAGRGATRFPDHILTNGLPSLVLLFHPYYSGHYTMACEGMTRWNGELAYQVYFRQRTDQPNNMHYYGLRVSGPRYPVALKGRAWISAGNYQIVRMEATLVAPIPQIQLLAEFTIIEYGPVHFRKTGQDLWLPKSVEYYYDWIGKRGHRHHKFDNYLLFSVDDKQRISAPQKTDSVADPAAQLHHANPLTSSPP